MTNARVQLPLPERGDLAAEIAALSGVLRAAVDECAAWMGHLAAIASEFGRDRQPLLALPSPERAQPQ